MVAKKSLSENEVEYVKTLSFSFEPPMFDTWITICRRFLLRSVCAHRVLSCSSLMQMLICEGVIQVVVGVSRSRVVTSSCSTMGSTLQVFALSDSSR